jgi:diguanylate cyclase (GGDEF)-like protein
MHADIREELQWLVQGVEDEISQLYRRLIPSVESSGALRPAEPASVLAERIIAALSDAGIGDTFIQTFKQAIEDFQKGEAWAQQAMKSTDRRRPLAVWSIERLGRARRRLREVSEFVTVRQARWPGKIIAGEQFSVLKRPTALVRECSMSMGGKVDSRCYYHYRLKRKLASFPERRHTMRRSRTDIVLPGRLVSQNHAQIVRQDSQFWILDKDGANGILVNGRRIERQALQHGDNIKIGSVDLQFINNTDADTNLPDLTLEARASLLPHQRLSRFVSGIEDPSIVRRFYELKELYDRAHNDLVDLAYKDPLTGLCNRRFFEEKTRTEVARCLRYHRPMQLAMLDVDDFKLINDTHGHQKGDEVLKVIAQVLLNNSRKTDTLVRYGGDEFLLLLPDTTAQQAFNVVEKIRVTVEHETVKQTGVTAGVSIGIARFSRINDSVEQLMFAADRMLLAAKVHGRNRIMVDEEAHALRAAEKESTETKTFRPGTRMKAFASPARELTEFTGRVRSVVLLGALVVAGGLLSFYPRLADRRSGIEAQMQALQEAGRMEPRQALLGTAPKEASPMTSDARESAVPMPPALALTPPAKETEHFGDTVNLTDKIAQKKSMLTGPEITRTREPGWRIASTRSVHGRVNEVRFAKTHAPRARAIAILECSLSRTDGNPQGASGSCETVAKQGT